MYYVIVSDYKKEVGYPYLAEYNDLVAHFTKDIDEARHYFSKDHADRIVTKLNDGHFANAHALLILEKQDLEAIKSVEEILSNLASTQNDILPEMADADCISDIESKLTTIRAIASQKGN